MPKQIGSRAILNKSNKISQMNDLQKKTGDWGRADKKNNTSTKYEKNNQSHHRDEKRPENKNFAKKNSEQETPESRKSDQKKPYQGMEKKKSGIKPACPYYEKCGGCQLQNMTYEGQLKWKQKQVEDTLKKFGPVDKIIGTKQPYNYRNKVQVVMDFDRRGNVLSGIFQRDTLKVLPIETCLTQDKKADEIIKTIRELAKSFKYKIYADDTEYGLLRHIVIKRGIATGEIMVVLVLTSPILPSKNNFVQALRQKHPEITSIIVNINDKRTNTVLGDREKTIYGKGYIEDILCGYRFRISSKSYYQINPAQGEILYGKALEYAGLSGEETVLDAYCGIGTISLIASKKSREVIGVDINPVAIKEAIINGKSNQVSNVTFYHSDAGKFVEELSESEKMLDVVFMEPGRGGSDETFMGYLSKSGAKKVVYISCNLESLEQDLKYLIGKGYKVTKIQPVDVFALTERVEVVILLTKNVKK